MILCVILLWMLIKLCAPWWLYMLLAIYFVWITIRAFLAAYNRNEI